MRALGLAAPPVGPSVRISDRTTQQPYARADRCASPRVTGNAADDSAARSAACCAAPGIVHGATGRAASPVKSGRWRPAPLRELHRGFARATGCHTRRRCRQTHCEQHRQAGRQLSQSVWHVYPDHSHPSSFVDKANSDAQECCGAGISVPGAGCSDESPCTHQLLREENRKIVSAVIMTASAIPSRSRSRSPARATASRMKRSASTATITLSRCFVRSSRS